MANEMNITQIDDKRVFGSPEAGKMMEKLRKYQDSKRSIDEKAKRNQYWWRLRHWETISGEKNEGSKAHAEVGSAWLVNSLANKHADMMDSFPKPNILARELDDQEEAQKLSSIVPVILEQNDYENIYRLMGWDFCIDGNAITGVFWDKSKNDGMGDITISNIDVHNLAWQPGITDIQDSDVVFHTTLQDVEAVKASWPEYADIIGPCDSGLVPQYDHDDNIDLSDKCEVVDCYYKRTIEDIVQLPTLDENGEKIIVDIPIPKTILHLAILIGGECVWCSENEPGYEKGFYWHGKYPFVFRGMFPVKDSIWCFGYLDIGKNPQKDIDKLDQAVIKGALKKANDRYWTKKNAAIDPEQFADYSNEIVEVGTGDIREQVGLIETGTVPATAQQHLERKIDELKETTGNRDFSQGATSSGVTAASAIAALQEAGSKLSRDINKELYRGAREEYYLIIELIRQFYDEPRSFRIKNGMGGYDFTEYSNANIAVVEAPLPGGEVRHRKPMFDIEITAEKQSPFSRAAQNETAKELYSMGLFHPENALPALTCLDMMEFEGKEQVVQKIQQNSVLLQQFNAAMGLIQQLAFADKNIFIMADQLGLIQMPEEQPQQQKSNAPSEKPSDRTPEEKAAGIKTDNSQATKARIRAANAAAPK